MITRHTTQSVLQPRPAIAFCLALIFIHPLTANGQKQWGSYGGSAGGGHFSPLAQINGSNVEQLELAWEHRSGDFREGEEGVEAAELGGQNGPSSAR